MIYKRFAARLKAQDWLAITIELTIVVVGVFIGTQVSNWNAGRLEKVETRRMLDQLRPELRAQIDFYDTAKAYYVTTRRFAGVALAGWNGDPAVSDDQFVIAAYQASQIQGAATNGAIWANILGADRLRSIDDPVLRHDLAFLMYSDNSTITINAVDTPYRRNVRRIIPVEIQEAIRARCGDYTPADRINIALLPEQCDITLPKSQSGAAAHALRTEPSLANDLRWHLAAEAAFLSNMQAFDIVSHKLLREIPADRGH